MKAAKNRRWGEQFMPTERIPYFLLQAFIGKYVFASQFVKDKVVLDMACGSGYGANYLKYKGARFVIGGDISEKAIHYATSRYQIDNLCFTCCDAQQLPFPDHVFDVVVSCETLEHLPRYGDFLSECTRILKESGVFICATPNKEFSSPYSVAPSNAYHIKEFNATELKDLVGTYFQDVAIYGMDPQVHIADKITFRIAQAFQPIIYSIPKSYLLVNLITKFIFRRYTLVKAEELEDSQFENFLESPYRHYLLENDFLPPGGLTAVATIQKKTR